jgi:hypothetical protein
MSSRRLDNTPILRSLPGPAQARDDWAAAKPNAVSMLDRVSPDDSGIPLVFAWDQRPVRL